MNLAEKLAVTRIFEIGIMQGRLSPPSGGRIQSFPSETWREEFGIAASLGLSSIEWIFESPLELNPLSSGEGLAMIRDRAQQTGVEVEFVCADYFMEQPLVRMSAITADNNQRVLTRLIECAGELGIKGIEIPCVDASAISNLREEDELCRALAPALELAYKAGIEIGLETSLNPDRFYKLLKRIDHPACKANYDTGNSASLGYPPREEFDAYGKWINNVHIKDRVLGGTTVPLGTGSADIPLVLRLLKQHNYSGGLILQAARQSGESETIRGYLEQLDGWMNAL
jgi:hexulose-6-phosphate isomerase